MNQRRREKEKKRRENELVMIINKKKKAGKLKHQRKKASNFKKNLHPSFHFFQHETDSQSENMFDAKKTSQPRHPLVFTSIS